MKLKLVDYIENDYKKYFYFQDETGTVYEIKGFFTTYGDVFEILVDDIEKFSQWVDEQDFYTPEAYDFDWLDSVAGEYRKDNADDDYQLCWLDFATESPIKREGQEDYSNVYCCSRCKEIR